MHRPFMIKMLGLLDLRRTHRSSLLMLTAVLQTFMALPLHTSVSRGCTARTGRRLETAGSYPNGVKHEKKTSTHCPLLPLKHREDAHKWITPTCLPPPGESVEPRAVGRPCFP